MFVPYDGGSRSGAYRHLNLNPAGNRTTDCTARAIALATGLDWDETYIRLCARGFQMKAMPDSDDVWWSYLEREGFVVHAVMSVCPYCSTVEEFCREHPDGVYVIATPGHVLCAVDGDWHDAWDSGGEIVLHYWTREEYR